MHNPTMNVAIRSTHPLRAFCRACPARSGSGVRLRGVAMA
jgi:hypothetical protein